jgi:hypothetical protein
MPDDGPTVVITAVTFDAMFGCGAGALEDLVEMVREVPFEGAMRYLGPLASAVYLAPRTPGQHLRIAARVFNADLYEAIRGWVLSEPGRVVFDERRIAFLQRLLIEHARDAPGVDMTLHEQVVLLVGLLRAGDVLPDRSPPDPAADGTVDRDEWNAYAIQVGAYYDGSYAFEAIARAYTMMIELAREPERVAECPIDKWVADANDGATLGDQLTFGIALATTSRALDPSLKIDERVVRIDPGFLASTGIADREAAIFKALSADRDEFQRAFAALPGDDQTAAWDHTPFEQRPFLRCEDGSLHPVSAGALGSWLSRGMYFRALDAAKARPHPTKPGKNCALRFLQAFGPIAERYVFNLVAASHEHLEAAGAATVSSERYYGRDNRRSPDVAVAQAPELVLMEVYSGRLRRQARISGTAEDVEVELRKVVVSKLNELQQRIADLLAGAFRPDGFPEGVTPQVWPMLVLAGQGVMQTPLLWEWVTPRLEPGAFGDARVAPPTIVDLDDLDPLLSLVEEGRTLPQLLAEFHASRFAQLSPINWIAARFERAAADSRPRYVERQADAAFRHVQAQLFPDSDCYDVARQRAEN